MDLSPIFRRIDDSMESMVSFLSRTVSYPAIGPESGGSGEMEKAEAIVSLLEGFGLSGIRRHDAVDDRVPSGMRPNIEVLLKGKSSERRLVIMTHMDVVPPGDLDRWTGDPFKARIENGMMIGRGVEDNGQALTAAVFALKVLLDEGVRPSYDVSLFIVSDEEESNEKGIGHLIREGLIGKDDLILVPDHGDPEGRVIETVEKTLLWVKITVKGRQCHASMPHLGSNAFRASMAFGTRVDRALHERFDKEDPSFDHPFSSFEPTRREPGVSGINVLPGADVFYFDCRLLPGYGIEEVLKEMRGIASGVEKEMDVGISIEQVFTETTLHPTQPDADIVLLLKKAVEKVTGSTPVTGGIGGGTCAALLRNHGFEAAVWETIHNRAHSVDEYISIDNLIKDCKVMAALCCESTD
ncbi:MAG: M20 family metallo-hydrolase [Thermoplasmatota archaeon]